MQTPLWSGEIAEVSAGKERHPLELPIPSLQERDRRWAALREKMLFRNLECLVLVGAGGLSGGAWPTSATSPASLRSSGRLRSSP